MHRRLLLAAVSLLACLTACTSSSTPDYTDEPTPTATPRPTARQLLGHWGTGREAARDDRGPRARFDYDGKFEGQDGCNDVVGTWSFDRASGVVRVVGRITTFTACSRTSTASFDRMTLDGASLSYVMASGERKTLKSAIDLNIPMYVIDVASHKLVPVPAPLPEKFATKTSEAKAAAAVEALMDVKEGSKNTYSTLWGTVCGLGTGVRSVEVGEASDPAGVVVTLTGDGGGQCDLTTREGYELRNQQLAWTVVHNLGVDEATAVIMRGPNGNELLDAPIVPDRAFLGVNRR